MAFSELFLRTAAQTGVLVLLLIAAGIAGWFVPRIYHLQSASLRVIILSAGSALWYSSWAGFAAWQLKRRFSIIKAFMAFGLSLLYFGLTEHFSAQLSRTHAVTVIFISVYAVVLAIILLRWKRSNAARSWH